MIFSSLLVYGQEETTGFSIRVEDASHGEVAGASVAVKCDGQRDVSGKTGPHGVVSFPPAPGVSCQARVTASGFQEAHQSITGHNGSLWIITLATASEKTEITVSASAAGNEEGTTAAAGTIEQQQIAHMPVLNRATGLTDLLTLTTPGVAADANGFAHPLGEHADTSLSLDGQPITDQQAKVFSNQIDPSIIQSLTAITGAPPAEFGDKTSLVVNVTTRSGMGQPTAGALSSEYGSFGTWAESLRFGTGGERWGNFVAASISGSGRFLDTPEFLPKHARGNNSSVFNRLDWRPSERDLLHVNVWAGRSWFQTPNSYDAEQRGQDQRSQIRNVNAALGITHVFSPTFLASVTPFYRHDASQYFPSSNLLADQPAALAQYRTLTNTGFRAEGQFASKAHLLKIGSTYWHTSLRERFTVGLTDPLYNALCLNSEGDAVTAPGIRDSQACETAGFQSNPRYLERLLPYDLSRGGRLYQFEDAASIVQSAFYLQDEIRWGRFLLSPGIRYDIYNGLSRGRQVQPRFGAGWRAPWSGTLLRLAYARLYETPYNENLVFANDATRDSSQANPFGQDRSEPVRPGTRNQFNAGLEQSFGPYVRVDADYYWKFTRNAFDFDTLFNTPITFSVAWRKSKIDGLALRARLLSFHGLTVSSVMGHVRSRFFTPEVGGLIFNSVPASGVFRIDHGEEFEQSTTVYYRIPKQWFHNRREPWISGVWRYNSGLALPDTVPVYTDALTLTANEQAQMGLRCGQELATPARAIRTCSASEFSATRIRIPPFGTQNDDRNPVRVAPRTLFDLSAGEDHLLRWGQVTMGLRVSVVNVTNRVALYNFLSTFSGTHFVPPRSYQAALQMTF